MKNIILNKIIITMFHTLFDYKDENSPNKQNRKSDSSEYNKTPSKSKNNYENNYMKGNPSYNYNYSNKENYEHNRNKTNCNGNQEFESTRNKIKIVVYKNGFILNNGPFRDKSIPENAEFLEQVERGVIPHEITGKGISDLGILLINRKTEKYHPHYSNTNVLNTSFNNLGQFNYPHQNYQNQNVLKNELNPNQISYKSTTHKKNLDPRKKSSINVQMSQQLNMSHHHLNHRYDRDEKDNWVHSGEHKEKEKGKKKGFKAFSGVGKIIKHVNMNGLYVNKNVKNNVDTSLPFCTIYIRLFDGEVAKCHFNYYNTLREIYFHVRAISGSSNFHLLDGFPPKPLRDYDKTIYELGLQNSMLTQRIN